jgi:hypothetical protein
MLHRSRPYRTILRRKAAAFEKVWEKLVKSAETQSGFVGGYSASDPSLPKHGSRTGVRYPFIGAHRDFPADAIGFDIADELFSEKPLLAFLPSSPDLRKDERWK